MKKSNLITIILLFIWVLWLYRLAQIYRSRPIRRYFAIILVTLIVIFLLRVVLRKKERLKRERQQQQDLSE